MMKITKIFKSGNSMAVRLPKEFKFQTDEVEIFKRDNEVVLREVPKSLSEVMNLFGEFPDDFCEEGRDDLPPQEREPL